MRLYRFHQGGFLWAEPPFGRSVFVLWSGEVLVPDQSSFGKSVWLPTLEALSKSIWGVFVICLSTFRRRVRASPLEICSPCLVCFCRCFPVHVQGVLQGVLQSLCHMFGILICLICTFIIFIHLKLGFSNVSLRLLRRRRFGLPWSRRQ